MKVKCNKCNYIGDEKEFPKGRDFLQFEFISSCPKCDNLQLPGGASMRGFGGKRPFEFVREDEEGKNIGEELTHRWTEAS